MKAKLVTGSVVCAIGACVVIAAAPAVGAGRGSGPVVYVTGQNLYYDTIVKSDLPFGGRFQALEMAGPTGLQTEFGPGDPGYLGGRWWVDANPNGIMDEDDAYFICPLLGPGRAAP